MTQLPSPPVAARRPHSISHHGTSIEDPYAWLRDAGYPDVTDADVLAYLDSENAYFEAAMAPHQALVDTLFAEMRGRIKEADESVPQKDGDWLYWRSFDEGAQYRKWWRAPVTGGEKHLILDEPALAGGKDYFRLGGIDVSPDGRLLAYAIDDNGSERFTIRIRNLETGEHLPEVIEGTLGAFLFAGDGVSLLYGLVNEHWRIDVARLHRLGTPVAEDVELYREADEGFQVGLGLTQSQRWIAIGTGDHVTSEVRLLPFGDPTAAPILVAERQPGREYDVEEHDGTLFIRTNDTHTNFRLVTAPVERPSEWTERIAPSADFYLTDVTTFAGCFVVEGREHGLDRVYLHDYGGGPGQPIDFPEASYSAGLDDNPEYAAPKLRLSYESMITPGTVLDYDLATGERTILKVQEIPSGYDATQYATERLEIAVRDGTKVPVSIVYKRDFVRPGPLYLYGYGAYGLAIEPGFSTSRLSLLDRGMAFAIADSRGGDDL
jgi:oligopeptidase B